MEQKMAKRDKLAQCRHRVTTLTWAVPACGRVVAERCCPLYGCGQLLSLGPSNDDSPAVQVEMAAAERIADISHRGGGESDVWCDDRTTEYAGGEWQDQFNAGYWAWDTSRPLAEQLAETARDDAEADALLDEINEPAPSPHLADPYGTLAAEKRERCLDEHGYGCTRAECGRSAPQQITGLSGPFDLSDTELVAAIAYNPPREPSVNVQFEEIEDGFGNVELIPIPLYSAEETAQIETKTETDEPDVSISDPLTEAQ
jgi:hypothetical protein